MFFSSKGTNKYMSKRRRIWRVYVIPGLRSLSRYTVTKQIRLRLHYRAPRLAQKTSVLFVAFPVWTRLQCRIPSSRTASVPAYPGGWIELAPYALLITGLPTPSNILLSPSTPTRRVGPTSAHIGHYTRSICILLLKAMATQFRSPDCLNHSSWFTSASAV